MAAVKALQQWCRVQCEGYRDVSITNMTTSFRDGMAFCALIHRHRPDLINFDSLKKENVYENNKLAFSVAEEQLGIPALLDAEDMVALAVPDRLSILTYVSQYYNYFHGRNPIGGLAGVKRPAEGGTEQQPAGKKNQPVRAKVFTSTGPSKENNPPLDHSRPSTNNKQDVPEERSPQTGTLSNKCVSCNKHVHLVQRYLVEGRLYHRNCAKTLTGGSYTADLHKNSLSRLTPDPDPPKTSPRSGPNWLTQKPSTPSSVSSSSTSSPEPVTPAPVSSPKTFLSSSPSANPNPDKMNITGVFSLRPTPSAPGYSSKPCSTFESPPSTVTPTPALTSITARNLKAKRNFFQSQPAEEKKTTNMAVSRGQGEESAPRHSVTVVVQVGGKDTHVEGKNTFVGGKYTPVGGKDTFVGGKDIHVERKDTSAGGKNTHVKGKEIRVGVKDSPVKGKDIQVGVKDSPVKGKEIRVGVKDTPVKGKDIRVGVKDTPVGGKDTPVGRSSETAEEERDQSKAKASAATFISKILTEEENNNKPTLSVMTKTTNDKKSPVEATKKETDRPRGRVKLRADPLLLTGLNSSITTTTTTTRGLNTSTSTAETRGAQKPRSPSPNISAAAESQSPSDWRARLKPVSKDTRLPASPGLTPTTDPPGPGPSISVTPPGPKGFTSPPKHTGNEAHSQKTKMKPDYIPKEEILRELHGIEDSLNELERTGVEMELKLRTSEENGEDESVMDELMVDWFTLIRNKQVAIRRESELVYIGRTQELEEEQPTVEQELRHLLDKPEHLKSAWERRREQQLMSKLVEIVNDRNAIVEGLDEDRLREEEEDEQMEQLMINLNLKKDKCKKKSSPVSKLFGWGGKKNT